MTPKKKVSLVAAAVMAVYFFHPSAWHPTRYGQLKCVINRRTGFAHMTRGMNTGTIQALREAVTEKDVPVLTQMLGDKDLISQMTAAQALARLGPSGRKALEEELEKMGPRLKKGQDYSKWNAIDEALKDTHR